MQMEVVPKQEAEEKLEGPRTKYAPVIRKAREEVGADDALIVKGMRGDPLGHTEATGIYNSFRKLAPEYKVSRTLSSYNPETYTVTITLPDDG
jgi:hypothetical protein